MNNKVNNIKKPKQNIFHIFPAGLLRNWYEFVNAGNELIKYDKNTKKIYHKFSIDDDYSINIEKVKTKHKNELREIFEYIEPHLTKKENEYLLFLNTHQKRFINKKIVKHKLSENEDNNKFDEIMLHFSISMMLPPQWKTNSTQDKNQLRKTTPYAISWALTMCELLNIDFNIIDKHIELFLKEGSLGDKFNYENLKTISKNLIKVSKKMMKYSNLNRYILFSQTQLPLFDQPIANYEIIFAKEQIKKMVTSFFFSKHFILYSFSYTTLEKYDKNKELSNVFFDINAPLATHEIIGYSNWQKAILNKVFNHPKGPSSVVSLFEYHLEIIKLIEEMELQKGKPKDYLKSYTQNMMINKFSIEEPLQYTEYKRRGNKRHKQGSNLSEEKDPLNKEAVELFKANLNKNSE